MDSQFPNRAAQNSIPPLEDIKVLGSLHYTDNQKTKAEVGISGIIDKGFFLADKEWTCYRRNYFSCACSYSLTPYIPGVAIELKMPGSRAATIHGFAMSISAVVAENDHAIDLVQHTPKRDKGPTASPSKVPMMAKQDSSHHHHHHRHIGFFGGNQNTMGGQQMYPDGWVPTESGGNGPQTEYTFERIQFKQATQNNGKRRAAQQYYHLIVELHANTGQPESPNWVKIAYRKSAKMIVRGRSPGHYQNDRRGSSSNGPSGSSGNSNAFGMMGGVRDFTGNPVMQPQPYPGYDTQGGLYGGHRHHALPPEALLSPEEEKAIENTKGYQYYPGSMCDGQANQRVDLWNHHSDSESMVPHVVAGVDVNGKVKNEYENNTLPRLVHPSSLSSSDQPRSCRPFDGKPTSNGYYPHVMSPSSMSITMQ
jgi:meiosis-specific transcription factor NDT80